MDVLVLDTSFQNVGVLDNYESLIWTDRYNAWGDFEISTRFDSSVLALLRPNYYLWIRESEHIMIIENTNIVTDVETGSRVIISGRSLESILDRRVVFDRVTLDGNFQDELIMLVDANLGPGAPQVHRRVLNLRFTMSTQNSITNKSIFAQLDGENLYDAVKALCDVYDIGFKITLDNSNQFVFSLYMGEDRSYGQNTNPYVIFSPQFDNFLNSNYVENRENIRTSAVIVGEEPEVTLPVVEWDTVLLMDDVATFEDAPRYYHSNGNLFKCIRAFKRHETYPLPYPPTAWAQGPRLSRAILAVDAPGGGGTGLTRREIFTDGSGIASVYRDDENNDIELTYDEYDDILRQKGLEDLIGLTITSSFEGQADVGRNFVLNEDFYIGDVVQIVNEFLMQSRVRMVELVRSYSTSGVEVYPTFVAV